ncbi:glycosyltransferase family 2 protein [Methylomonas sp. UP202]|uniref:glycosyltransferase family 2 protein n=1 Tax=Methylomonas sp. UP202 TaxID=3040943 RepID=UPI00143B875F|nr:glycosyltransferase family 2 protein [Methylomonas sp. UP202]NJA04835.1 glycosyltransferase family 2 protein [Methylococcaceae bacterium WWC4]WGS87807.1 glycosyltransferase family 2 protein [Methylomonas sp. UP202]
MSHKVSVIIVNWNGDRFLERCLSTLLVQSIMPHEIILVDNASSDASLNIVQYFSTVKLLPQNENLGFARGNNLAINIISPDSEWIALLNPDAFPNPDWLERLLAAADSYPEVSVFASLQMCDDNAEVIDGAGDSYHVSGLVWRDHHGGLISPMDRENKPVFSPCAAAALYRRQALIDVGGFDEDFFCYVEDVDLGFRLRLAGHQAMLVGDAVVRHVGSASTGRQRSDFCVYHGHRNLVWTFVKNMPGLLFWLLLPVHLALNLISVVYFSIVGQGGVILRAKYDALKGVSKMWQKRQIIQSRRIASLADIWRVLDKRILPFK